MTHNMGFKAQQRALKAALESLPATFDLSLYPGQECRASTSRSWFSPSMGPMITIMIQEPAPRLPFMADGDGWVAKVCLSIREIKEMRKLVTVS
jgi:hypothetical protein